MRFTLITVLEEVLGSESLVYLSSHICFACGAAQVISLTSSMGSVTSADAAAALLADPSATTSSIASS